MKTINVKWTLEQRENAQNKHLRQDKLCMSLGKPDGVERTWLGYSCIGDVTFKTLDEARDFAESMGYDGIIL